MNTHLRPDDLSLKELERDLPYTRRIVRGENSSLRFQASSRSKYRALAHLRDRPEAKRLLTYKPTIKLNKEQDLYVRWPILEHSVLGAPPGSGKTRCILERARCLVENKLMAKENIFLVAFSNPACAEARERTEAYKDYEEWLSPDNIITIDASARKVLLAEKNPKANSVELLSLLLNKLLNERSRSEVRRTPYINAMRMVFVDEVQDIDRKQYNIFCNLADKLNCTISMVGDPNQALYRFRGGSSRYMFKFQSRYNAREFHLIKNYRSTANIVAFFKGLRSMVFHDIEATRPAGKPVRIMIRHRKTMHKWIVAFLKSQKNLEQVAILCPTKGTGAVKDVGLSVASNLLHSNGIPFIQHYDEAVSDDVRARRNTTVPGKVNLVTYIGSKAKEWKIVILMDFHNLLYNRIPQTMTEYWDQRNLLYVACSRAMDELIICSYKDKAIHPWISCVDPSTYVCDNGDVTSCPFAMGWSSGKPQQITDIPQIVDRLSPEALNSIHELMNITVTERRLIQDRSEIPRGNDDALLATFSREVLLMQVNERLKQPHKKYPAIESFIGSNLIVLKDRDHSKVRTYMSRNRNMTWELFSKENNVIEPEVRELILERFNRKIEFSSNIISTGEAKKILDENRNMIRSHYDRYMAATDWISGFNSLFYLVLIMQCIETGHYYHMSNGGRDKLELLRTFLTMFTELDTIAAKIVEREGAQIEQAYSYGKLGITGRSDMVAGDCLIDVRCGSDLYIKHYIQMLLANFCWKGRFTSTSSVINPIRGVEYRVEIKVSTSDMWKILNIVADHCNLKFTNLHVIFDLETTGLIENRNGKQIMPELVQITMREYETGLLIYNLHNRPVQSLTKFITKLIGVTDAMLVGKPDISKTKKWLSQQMRNVTDVAMYAHNGLRFDAVLMEHYQLIPCEIKVVWKDTIALIKSHYNGKLTSCSLGNVYKQFFNEPIEKAHTSIADVDALIKILNHLGVKLI
jgi:DNA polymerase III epsilon subunit-like protein